MSAIDRLVAGNLDHAAAFVDRGLGPVPALQVAVVTCMDARLDVYRALGLEVGEAHVLRNAGGILTEDVLRSLVISQRKLGTTEIMLVQHTDCGMTSFTDAALSRELEAEIGERPPFAFGAFVDHVEEIRHSILALAANPFVDASKVRGFVYDVSTGRLLEVDPPQVESPGSESPKGSG